VNLLQDLVDVCRVCLCALLLALLLVIGASCCLLGSLASFTASRLYKRVVEISMDLKYPQKGSRNALAALPPVDAGAFPPVEAGALDAGLGGMVNLVVSGGKKKKVRVGERKEADAEVLSKKESVVWDRLFCPLPSFIPQPAGHRKFRSDQIVASVFVSYCASEHASTPGIHTLEGCILGP
jgi:hypothetical protein